MHPGLRAFFYTVCSVCFGAWIKKCCFERFFLMVTRMNWLKYRSMQFPWGTGPFPWMRLERKRANLRGCAVLSPSEFCFPLYRVHAMLFCSIFSPYPLSSINLCFLLNVDTAGSMAVVPKFMSIFNSPPVQPVSCWVGLVAAAYLLKAFPILASAWPHFSPMEVPAVPRRHQGICSECARRHLQIFSFWSCYIWV